MTRREPTRSPAMLVSLSVLVCLSAAPEAVHGQPLRPRIASANTLADETQALASLLCCLQEVARELRRERAQAAASPIQPGWCGALVDVRQPQLPDAERQQPRSARPPLASRLLNLPPPASG